MPNHNQIQANLKPHHRLLVQDILLAGGRITQVAFCDLTSTASRLAPRIYDLKQRGYPITKDMIDLGDGTHVAEYYLPKWFLSKVGTYGLEIALRGELLAKQVQEQTT